MIASLRRKHTTGGKRRGRSERYLKAAEKLHKDLQKAMIEFYNRKDELDEQARQEAKSIVRMQNVRQKKSFELTANAIGKRCRN